MLVIIEPVAVLSRLAYNELAIVFMLQFEDSMIMKIFLFQFVNSYASFFYLAFVAKGMGECLLLLVTHSACVH